MLAGDLICGIVELAALGRVAVQRLGAETPLVAFEAVRVEANNVHFLVWGLGQCSFKHLFEVR